MEDELSTDEIKSVDYHIHAEWRDTGEIVAGDPVFECVDCGEKWSPENDWVPRDADGRTPPNIVEALRAFQAKQVDMDGIFDEVPISKEDKLKIKQQDQGEAASGGW